MYKKVKSVIGAMEDGNTNYTLKRVTNMKPIMSGVTAAEIKNLTRDSSFVDIIKKIAESDSASRATVSTERTNK